MHSAAGIYLQAGLLRAGLQGEESVCGGACFSGFRVGFRGKVLEFRMRLWWCVLLLPHFELRLAGGQPSKLCCYTAGKLRQMRHE